MHIINCARFIYVASKSWIFLNIYKVIEELKERITVSGFEDLFDIVIGLKGIK